METKELIEAIRDYTERYDMPLEIYLMLTEAVERLEKLSAENKQLYNDLIMQTALAQNGQSAIETNRQLTKQLNAAIEDIKKAIDDEILCNFCKHDAPCSRCSENNMRGFKWRGVKYE